VDVPEELQERGGFGREGLHRAEQWRFVVERLAVVAKEDGRDAQRASADVLDDEDRRGRVPGGITAGFERRTHAARREARSVRLTLDQLAAGETLDHFQFRVIGVLDRDEGIV